MIKPQVSIRYRMRIINRNIYILQTNPPFENAIFIAFLKVNIKSQNSNLKKKGLLKYPCSRIRIKLWDQALTRK